MPTLTSPLTVQEAAAATGWSARMLRYVEQLGLVVPPRSPSGYRLYGPAQLQRLRTLRALLAEHDVELGDVGFALRLRREAPLATALDDWFSGTAPLDARPTDSPPDPARADPGSAWLAFEQHKHAHLLDRPLDRQEHS